MDKVRMIATEGIAKLSSEVEVVGQDESLVAGELDDRLSDFPSALTVASATNLPQEIDRPSEPKSTVPGQLDEVAAVGPTRSP